MRIVNQALRPLYWGAQFARLAIESVAIRILLQSYTFICSRFPWTKVATEIETLDKAIAALDTGNVKAAKEHLALFNKEERKTTEPVVDKDILLEALTVHRYSVTHMWKGVDANHILNEQIKNFAHRDDDLCTK